MILTNEEKAIVAYLRALAKTNRLFGGDLHTVYATLADDIERGDHKFQ